ncbi:hypothetical protein [Fusobacterium hwasookii]|uniref:hypothetical protein n=1 Tax=Fusobacterium hwasookii TaxID=1583098 RepID=UPI0004967A8A|nr:hypothetical protein [Fusobacterium hwasookii]ALQ38798.1 hypothetical protein RN97_11625 [Fusobacterium hwasookii ChDC F300]
MKKIFKILVLILIVSLVLACGKKKEYKNEKAGVTDTNYHELVLPENLSGVMHDGNESSFKEKDISNALQCLKTTYDNVALGDIVKFIDTQAGAHLIGLVYNHDDDTGTCNIWWTGVESSEDKSYSSLYGSYITLSIPFSINSNEEVFPLEFSEKIKDFLNELPKIIPKKYPEKLSKNDIKEMVKEMENDYIKKRYIPYINIGNEIFSINQFKNFMKNPEIFKNKYGVYDVSSPIDIKPTDDNIIVKAENLLLSHKGKMYNGNLYNGDFKRDIEKYNTADEQKLMFSHFEKLIEGNEIFSLSYMSTDLFSLTKKIAKKLNANIKSQSLKSDGNNVYYIVEFYNKDKNETVAMFGCVIDILNTNQGQVVSPSDNMELDFPNGEILTNSEIGEFVDESWLK